jgi:hypothetical protein
MAEQERGRILSTLAVRHRLIDIARGEVGVREKGNNTGPRVKEYQAATNLAGTGWFWCAAFVGWCIREWGKEPATLAALGFTKKQQFEVWRPKTAGAWAYEDWARQKGLQVLPEDAPLRDGDIMIFDMHHIGIVVTDQDNVITTIEGNTNSAGSRDGGGVMQKQRSRSMAKCFIRLLP